jgi:transposase
VGYQEPKNQDFGVNLCDGCLAKQCEIDRLKEENQRLRQKLNLNERKGTEGFFKSSTSSAKLPVKPNAIKEKQAQKGGGQSGHRGIGRISFTASGADERRTAEVEVGVCETCQCGLHQHSANEREIYELERERVKKIHYEIERKRCPKCRKIVSGKVKNAFGRVALSNELVAEIAEQHYVLGRSLGQIVERFGLKYATVVESLHRLGEKLKPNLVRLKEIFRQAEVRHADETGWRTDGGNGYAWYFGAAQVSLYLFRQTRSASVPEEVFGKEQLSGVLVVDQYAGYNRVPCSIQYCYAHLLRKQEDLAKEFPKNREVQAYTKQMIKRLGEAMRLRNEGLSNEQYLKKAARIKEQIFKLSERPARHPAVRNWQDFYVEQAERLYQWCENPKIPAENNYAEREVRKIVIARKISYGSQSEAGAETREIWTSVLASLAKREANPRAKLVEGLNKLAEDENFDIAEFLFGETKSDSD